ncbi:50S ribosomal protein L18e [Caldiplasma sukawensis]
MVKMSLRADRKENPDLKKVIEELNRVSRENNSPFWRDIAERLAAPSQNHAEVNVGKIGNLLNENEVAVIPGKILGAGYISKKVKVSAFSISEKARKKLEEAGSQFISILDLAQSSPKGSNIKILG